jgi:hypothetical protein
LKAKSVLQWALLNELSADSNNKVIGIVRNAPATEKRVKEELSGRANITILAADLTDYDALKVQIQSRAQTKLCAHI